MNLWLKRGKLGWGDDEPPFAASISPGGEIFYQMPRKSLICSEIGRRVPIVRHISSSAATLVLPVNEGQLATLQQRSARPVVKNLPKCCLMPSNAQQKSGPDKHRNEMAGQFFLASCPAQDFQAN